MDKVSELYQSTNPNLREGLEKLLEILKECLGRVKAGEEAVQVDLSSLGSQFDGLASVTGSGESAAKVQAMKEIL